MMAGVGVGVGFRIHRAGVMGTGLGGGFSCVRFAGNMVTLGVNAGGASDGTLRDGTGQSVWSVPVGTSRSVFWVTAVGGFSVTFEKMHGNVCMAANFLSPSFEKGVGVGCRRDLAPYKHSRASSQRSLRIPRQLLPKKHFDSHLLAHSKRIVPYHL